MAFNIEASPESLRTLSAKIETAAGEYQTLYGTNLLTNDIGEVETAWKSKDSEAFADQIRGFKDDFDKMNKILLEYSAYLKTCAETYDTTINTLSTEAKSLKN